jgi:hypothetical protein
MGFFAKLFGKLMRLDAEIRVLKSSQKSCVNLKQEHPYCLYR